jgi:pilus assembly protein CpaF
MQDQDVEDILINGYQNVFISRRGCCTNRPWPSVTTSICCALCSACWPWAASGRIVAHGGCPPAGRRAPECRHPPLALDGPLVSIRKFRQEAWGMDDLVRMGSLDAAMSSCCTTPCASAATS